MIPAYKLIQMPFEEWAEKYGLIKNHINPDSGFDGELFETYGAEEEYVRTFDPLRVWTWCDGEDGTFITDGYHWVNRIGYLLTEKPAESGVAFEIKVDDYGDDV